MSKKLLSFVVACVISVLISIFIFWGYIYFVAFQNTIYASEYSSHNFHKIEVAMNRMQVEELLPESIAESYYNGKTSIFYTDRKKDTHYLVRKIVFDAQETVVEIESKLYFD